MYKPLRTATLYTLIALASLSACVGLKLPSVPFKGIAPKEHVRPLNLYDGKIKFEFESKKAREDTTTTLNLWVDIYKENISPNQKPPEKAEDLGDKIIHGILRDIEHMGKVDRFITEKEIKGYYNELVGKVGDRALEDHEKNNPLKDEGY